MFSTEYQKVDQSVPGDLIEHLVRYGYVVVHPKKPRWMQATPKLERSIHKIMEALIKSRTSTIAHNSYPVMN
jgi:hypothetical protein